MNIFTPVRAISTYLLSFALLFLVSISSIFSQRCAPVQGLVDSITTTHYYVKWQAHPTARSYKVSYWDANTVVNQQVTTNKARFTRTTNAPFEVISVQGICPGGNLSDPEYNIKGGIVITLDDIYRISRDCGNTSFPYGFVLFSDACVGVSWQVLCNTIPVLPGVNESYTIEDWTEQLMIELEEDLFPWPDFADCPGIYTPRLQAPIMESGAFPNPFSTRCTVHIENVQSETLHLNIVNIQGRQVWKKGFSTQQNSSFKQEIMLNDLPAGLYFLQAKGAEEAWFFKLIKE